MRGRTVIEVVVSDEGHVDATLLTHAQPTDGCPVEGHGDYTGTLSIDAMVDPLVRSLKRRVTKQRVSGGNQ